MIFSFFYDKNDSFFFSFMIYKLHCVCVCFCFRFGAFFGLLTISLEPLKRISQVSSISQSQSLRLEMDVKECQFLLLCFACRRHRTNKSQKKKINRHSLQVKAARKTNLKKGMRHSEQFDLKFSAILC